MQSIEDAGQDQERVGFRFYVQELQWLLRLGLQLSATVGFDMLQQQIAVAFAGHSRKEELDALGLAIAFYNLVVICPAYAISGAFSGRLGAAFGAKRLDLMRADLHRSILVGAVIILGKHKSMYKYLRQSLRTNNLYVSCLD